MPDLLRICTAGSVDDGKSTLIGRLLYDSRGVYEDQIHSVTKASRNRSAGPIDFSLFTDGLRAEREQGITIDVAYRYFATARRKFILADTPGHEQYTRNMATGASTADLAILLVDARHGVREQTRRHARIAELLGIVNLVLAVNKMDLVGYDRRVFDDIRSAFAEIQGDARVHAIPLSALNGDNVITTSDSTPWFDGPSLLEHLETVEIDREATRRPFRLPVQLVSRPSDDFRGYAGQICSGVVNVGDAIRVWPANRSSRVQRIVTWDGDLEQAFAPMSVTLTLEDELDISRGDVLAIGATEVGNRFEADIVWMDERSLDPDRVYLLEARSDDRFGGNRSPVQVERDRRSHGGRVAPDRVRHLWRRSRDRQLHPDRSSDQFHGRRGHDHPARRRVRRRRAPGGRCRTAGTGRAHGRFGFGGR